MSHEDTTDLLLLALAAAALLALFKLTADYLRPVPFRRRVMAQVRERLG